MRALKSDGACKTVEHEVIVAKKATVCNEKERGHQMLLQGTAIQYVTRNCYECVARTCYKCGFRVCIPPPVPLLQLPKVLHQCKEGGNVVLRALKKGKAAVLEFVVKLIPVGNKVECAVAPFVNQLVVENKNLLQCL